MRRTARLLAGALALALPLAACGDDDGDGRSSPPAAPDPADDSDGLVLDVAGALAAGDGTSVRVSGHLIALPGGGAELCGGPVMESAPPQCGGPALPVDGLDDPAAVPGATDAGGWVEGDVVLAGTMRAGRLEAG